MKDINIEKHINLIINDIIYNIGTIPYNELKDYIYTILLNIYHKSEFSNYIIDQIICYRIKSYNNRYLFKYSVLSQSNILKNLLLLPKSKAQKSIEWLEFRHNHINASEIHQIFSNSRLNLLYHKCHPYIHKNTNSNSLTHGNTFEHISNLIHMDKIGKHIYEFESIEHPIYKFIAASPDGITENGILVEYKNPKTRNIIGAPKDEYWVQTQIQMAVTNLERCHFVECNYNFYNDIESLILNSKTIYYGIIISYFNENSIKHIYSDIKNNTLDSLTNWLNNQLNTINYDISIKYWSLNHYSLFIVYRDHKWFSDSLPMLISFWNDVLYYRENLDKIPYTPRVRSRKEIINKTLFIDSD